MNATGTVVRVIGATLLLCAAMIGALAFTGHPIPDVLQNIAVGSLTGLVGLLVPRPGAGAADEG